MTRLLSTPEPGRAAAEAFVAEHFAHLICDDVRGSGAFAGGQRAADAALAGFDVAGYAAKRNEVQPAHRRGASKLSPYIRHGLLTLRSVWDHVGGGPSRDVRKFRDELLWQEFSRHWYGRLGGRTRHGVRNELNPIADHGRWNRDLACIATTVGELETDGWLVNQTRMWLASHWAVRGGLDWSDGEDEFFRHLLDGSRAANRLGWQWTTGIGSSKHYGFSRQQVEKRAPGLCATCTQEDQCPIENWPSTPALRPSESPALLRADEDLRQTAGPSIVERTSRPDTVWLTAESLGGTDPALVANADLPVVFVFDEPLLEVLRLSSKRLIFLTETLAELADGRELGIFLGSPAQALEGRNPAVTFAPVPGFRSRAAALGPAEIHPWPWLVDPHEGSIASFSAWRRAAAEPT